MQITLDQHEKELLIEAAQLCGLRLEVHTEGDYVATLWNGSAKTPMKTWPQVAGQIMHVREWVSLIHNSTSEISDLMQTLSFVYRNMLSRLV